MFFNVGGLEILVVAVIALIAIGPEQLPSVMRKVGGFLAQARSVTNGLRDEFMSGVDDLKDVADPASWLGTGSKDDPVVPRGFAKQQAKAKTGDTAEDDTAEDDTADVAEDDVAAGDDVAEDDVAGDDVAGDDFAGDDVAEDEVAVDDGSVEEAAPDVAVKVARVDPDAIKSDLPVRRGGQLSRSDTPHVATSSGSPDRNGSSQPVEVDGGEDRS